ncbi:ABC transporter substrate-binding protein [Mycetocola lacteus]|uniref:ABC transporter substrate-binding protein n=1 Tax=Mycetocola lacteus TaxID=76637 RepID=A0A3L7AU55_9MICO|nr:MULTISPECIES: ABC transporter substrate-binding protein [Mycetocola]RLP84049.1 ABC transporter substrate-binding protein [Mycetocola lacteus]
MNIRGAKRGLTLAMAAGAIFALSACASGDPLSGGGSSAAGDTIAIGSAAFAENEIIAQIYAQALEAKDIKVDFKGQIGQRDVYLKALEDGSLDIVPEYSGNLLQAFDKDSKASTSEEVEKELGTALTNGLAVLKASPAENKDSYNVTKEFSEQNNVKSLADLAGLDRDLTVGGNPELEQRPYGPPGLESIYGLSAAKIKFVPLSDSGGPLTVGALKDGTVDLADIFSTTPAIKENGFVTLEDPKNMILPQNVIPLVSKKANTDKVAEVLNKVSAELTTEDLIELNGKNQGAEKASPKQLATDWLKEKKLI